MFDGESAHPEQVMELILKEARRMRKEGLDGQLFEAVRRDIYGKSIRRFDVSESVCSMLTDATVLGYDLFEYFNCLATVTAEDVTENLSVFTEERAVLSVIEPINSKGEN